MNSISTCIGTLELSSEEQLDGLRAKLQEMKQTAVRSLTIRFEIGNITIQHKMNEFFICSLSKCRSNINDVNIISKYSLQGTEIRISDEWIFLDGKLAGRHYSYSLDLIGIKVPILKSKSIVQH